jgi:hypothetical protein
VLAQVYASSGNSGLGAHPSTIETDVISLTDLCPWLKKILSSIWGTQSAPSSEKRTREASPQPPEDRAQRRKEKPDPRTDLSLLFSSSTNWQIEDLTPEALSRQTDSAQQAA